MLAFPNNVDEDGQLRTAGSTTVLPKAAGRTVAPLPHPTGGDFERIFRWGSTPSLVTEIEPMVVDVSADASAETGLLRHAARLHRARPDLDIDELR